MWGMKIIQVRGERSQLCGNKPRPCNWRFPLPFICLWLWNSAIMEIKSGEILLSQIAERVYFSSARRSLITKMWQQVNLGDVDFFFFLNFFVIVFFINILYLDKLEQDFFRQDTHGHRGRADCCSTHEIWTFFALRLHDIYVNVK